jgi:hypothetical protein
MRLRCSLTAYDIIAQNAQVRRQTLRKLHYLPLQRHQCSSENTSSAPDLLDYEVPCRFTTFIARLRDIVATGTTETATC